MLLTLNNTFGQWTHDVMNIGNKVAMGDYFMTRDDNQQIHLSLKAMHSSNPPTGEFCCEFPDASGVTQTQCVEIGMVWIFSYNG